MRFCIIVCFLIIVWPGFNLINFETPASISNFPLLFEKQLISVNDINRCEFSQLHENGGNLIHFFLPLLSDMIFARL